MLKAIWGLLNAYGICWDKKLLLVLISTFVLHRLWGLSEAQNSGVRRRAASYSFFYGDIIYELRLFKIHFDTYFLPSSFCVQHLFPPKKMLFVPSPCGPPPRNISADLCMKRALAANASVQERICLVAAHQQCLFQSLSANKGFYGIAGVLLSVQEAKSCTV